MGRISFSLWLDTWLVVTAWIPSWTGFDYGQISIETAIHSYRLRSWEYLLCVDLNSIVVYEGPFIPLFFFGNGLEPLKMGLNPLQAVLGPMAQILKTHLRPHLAHYRHLLGPFGAISTYFGFKKKGKKKVVWTVPHILLSMNSWCVKDIVMTFHDICPYPLGPNTLSQGTRFLPFLLNNIDYRDLKLTNH